MAGTSTFSTEYGRLIRYTGDNSTAALPYQKQSCNDALLELCEAHDWPWLYYEGAVNLVGAYSTGTITIVDDTTDYVTVSGGSWTTTWSPVRIRTAGGNDYKLTYNSGNTRWEMDRNLVEAEAAVTYTLYKDVYPVAARMRSTALMWPIATPDYPVKLVDPNEMRVLKTGDIYATDPVSHACFTEPDSSYITQLEVFPAPATANSLHYKGYRQVATLSNDADTYPFPAQILPVYRHLALSYVYDYRGRLDAAADARAKYELTLSRAVNRADPHADAGNHIRLDEQTFINTRYRDERPRLGITY